MNLLYLSSQKQSLLILNFHKITVLKGSHWTINISATWELVRNENYWASSQNWCIRNLEGWSPANHLTNILVLLKFENNCHSTLCLFLWDLLHYSIMVLVLLYCGAQVWIFYVIKTINMPYSSSSQSSIEYWVILLNSLQIYLLLHYYSCQYISGHNS